MAPCVYILYSKNLNRFYVGYSSNLEERLIFHENAESRKFTSNADDWVLFNKINCESKAQGLAVEAHIKRMKSKKYIENLFKYPEMLNNLLNKYRIC